MKEQFDNSYQLQIHATNILKEYVSNGHQEKTWIRAIKARFSLHQLSDNTIIKKNIELISKASHNYDWLWGNENIMQFIYLYYNGIYICTTSQVLKMLVKKI